MGHFQGFMDRAGVMSLSMSHKIGNMLVPPSLVALVFMISKWCVVLPASVSASLIVGFIVCAFVLPGIVYKKVTRQNAPSSLEENTEAMKSFAGLVHHSWVDTSIFIIAIAAWLLMGPEYQHDFMAWVPSVRVSVVFI